MHATQVRRHAAQPETADALEHVKAVAAYSIDPGLLDLCRRRLAELLDDGPPVTVEDLGERERAYVRFIDQFVFSVASLGEGDVAALLEHAEPLDVYQFTCALYTYELSLRIEIATRAVLPGPEDTP